MQGVMTRINTYSPACFKVRVEGQPESSRRIIK